MLLFTSCRKDDLSKADWETIHNDENFMVVYEYLKELNQKSIDYLTVKKIGDGNTELLTNVHVAFNYSTYEDFLKEYKKFSNSLLILESKYGIVNRAASEWETAILLTESKNSDNFELGSFVASSIEGGGDPVLCEKQRRACLTRVYAETMVMHTGCLVADLSLVLGIVCHSAATAFQIFGNDECNVNYEVCLKSN